MNISKVSFVLIILVIVWLSATSFAKEEKAYECEEMTVMLEQPEFFLADRPDVKSVMDACRYYGVQDCGIVVSQAILETGHFKSDNCVKNNNLFGLYNAKRKRYYRFGHWSESVVAYRDKVQYKRKPDEAYYDFLLRIGYAKDKKYIHKVKDIKKRYKL